MANANGWGDGASNNNIGWGKGADNAIGWGSVYSVSEAGATDIIGTPAVDPDAQAFITAAAITDPTQQSAINTLVTDLKGYSIWTKFKAIYPVVGGSASSHAVNLITPGTYNLTFASGMTHSANGMVGNGSSAYADTALNPNSALTLNSTHISFYSRTSTVTNGERDMGVYTSADNPIIALGTNTGVEISDHYNFNNRISGSIASATGFYIGTRTTSTSHKLYKNNSTLGTNTTTNSNLLPNGNVFICAVNLTSFYNIYSTKQCAFASIGDGLTDTDAANFYTAVQAYQTTLGRSIGTQTVSDADAQAFVTAANITDQVEANAVNNLVIGMKADGIWTKMKAIYPIVGGSASSHAVNLKTPGTFNLAFTTGWTHSANGMQGTNAYANSNLNVSTNLSQNSTHISVYIRTNNASAAAAISASRATAPILNLFPDFSGLSYFRVNSDNIGAGFSTGGSHLGLWVANRISSSEIRNYRNTTRYINAVTSTGLRDQNVWLGSTPDFADYYINQYAFASIGDGLTDTDAANFYTLVNTYQTALSRNV